VDYSYAPACQEVHLCIREPDTVAGDEVWGEESEVFQVIYRPSPISFRNFLNFTLGLGQVND
jgi:hypothetical protein